MKKSAFFIKSPENIFTVISLIFGILFLLITPPFQAPDEYQHFYRSFQISEGHFISEKKTVDCYGREIYTPATTCVGGMLPKSVLTTAQQVSKIDLRFHPERKQKVQDILSLLNLPLESQNKIFIRFPNAALYSPIPYLPQALGMAFGKLLGFSPLILLYLGRLVNLFIWIGLVYLAIKIIPIYQSLVFLLALTPMSLFQAASLSADAFTAGVAFVLIAIILQYSFDKKNKLIMLFDIIILSLFSGLLALSKSAYFPIIGLCLLIPINKFENRNKYYFSLSLVGLLSLIAMAGWSLLLKNLYIPLKPLASNVSPEAQLAYILENPFNYLSVNLKTLFNYGINYLEQFIGRLGWLDTPLPIFHIISYALILLLVALAGHRSGIVISCRQKMIILIILIFNTLLITTAMYLSWTAVGAGIIEGIQGRYFIPLAPLFFLLLYNPKINIKLKIPSSTIACYSIFSCTLTAAVLLKRYYL